MSRLKLKVNNCLLNNKEFFKLFNSIFNKIGYNCFIIFQDYLKIKILKYDENFEILYIFFNFQNLKFVDFWTLILFGKLWPPTDSILTPLPMEYRPPYPWNIDPPTHGISTPLPMVYWTPYPWYRLYRPPLSMVFWSPYTWYFDLPAYLLIRNGGGGGGSKYHGGSIYHTGVQFSIRGFNIPWM